MSVQRIGAHVDRPDPLGSAALTNSEVIQLFLSAPQTWAEPKLRGDEAALSRSGLGIYVHAPYLLNPASLNPAVRERSRLALQQQCRAARRIGATGLIVHGGHPTGSGTVDDGIAGWLEVLDGLELETRVLIENTAGGNAAVARRFDDFARLLDSLRSAGHDIGVCIDTCHAHAGGETLHRLVERVHRFAGRIDFIHANDSKDGFDSGRDRHQNLGAGECQLEEIIETIRLASCDVVVETPGGVEAMNADVHTIREHLPARP
jgi:deoxyribonuclease-4